MQLDLQQEVQSRICSSAHFVPGSVAFLGKNNVLKEIQGTSTNCFLRLYKGNNVLYDKYPLSFSMHSKFGFIRDK